MQHIIIQQELAEHTRYEEIRIYLAVVNMQFLGKIEYWIQYCDWHNNNNNNDNEISNLGGGVGGL